MNLALGLWKELSSRITCFAKRAAVGEISPEDEGLRKGESFPAAGRQSSVTSERTCKVVAWATNPSCARAAKRAGADAVYVPVLNFRRGQSVLAGIRQDDPEQAGYPKQCVMALPTIDHDPLPSVREYQLSFDLWDYVREGKLVYADSLASVWFVCCPSCCRLITFRETGNAEPDKTSKLV